MYTEQGAASGGLEQLLQAIPSGELQQLVGGPVGAYSGGLNESPFRGGYGSGAGSMGVAKLESMELPDAAAAVAMLHDMPPEVISQQERKSAFSLSAHILTLKFPLIVSLWVCTGISFGAWSAMDNCLLIYPNLRPHVCIMLAAETCSVAAG